MHSSWRLERERERVHEPQEQTDLLIAKVAQRKILREEKEEEEKEEKAELFYPPTVTLTHINTHTPLYSCVNFS